MNKVKRTNKEKFDYGRYVVLAITLFTLGKILPFNIYVPGGFESATIHWAIGLAVIGFGIIAFIFSKKSNVLMTIFFILYLIDTALLIIFLLLFFQEMFSGNFVVNVAIEMIVRIAAIIYLIISLIAYGKKDTQEKNMEEKE